MGMLKEEAFKWLVSRRAPEGGVWQGYRPFFHAHLVAPLKIKGIREKRAFQRAFLSLLYGIPV